MTTLPWEQSGWQGQANAWIYAELKKHTITVTGDITQPYIRPWSTVLLVPTNQGNVYFKATAAMLKAETAVTAALHQWKPDCMPQVLGVDTGRGWLLMEDAGATLRSVVNSPDDFQHWREVLPLYAQVQQEMTAHVQQLISLGIFDRRLSMLPTQFEGLLADTDMLLIDQPESITHQQVQQLQDFVPTFQAMCAELAAFGIPETLHHDDFHDANIFVKEGRYCFTDWGESAIAHPFFSLLITLRSLAYRLKLADDEPALSELRDVYLAAWTDYAPMPQLQKAFALAQKIAMLNRTLTWYHVVRNLDSPYREQEADSVPGWLLEFYNAVM